MRRILMCAVLAGASGAGVSGETMRAIVMTGKGGPEVLQLQKLAIPEPGKGQVRIRVHAAGVNPVDWKIRERGAVAVATASSANHEYLKALGADEVIDYRTTRFEDRVKNADAVLDTVGGETLQRSPAVLRKGGVLLQIAGRLPQEQCDAAGIRCWATGAPAPGAPIDEFGGTLTELSKLADVGKLRITLSQVLPLEEAARAQELSKRGHTRGKIILRIAAP